MILEVKIGDRIIEIRRPRSVDEYRKMMDVQVKIWGMRDYSEAVTYHLLLAVDHNGGLVLGAFDKNTGEPVGLVFGFPAIYEGKLVHYSHMAGVIPEYRFKGLGYILKLEQRKHALNQGLDLILWTYDPLQSPNAWFNIGKLGVIARKYLRNYYGEMRDDINVGMPSDRFKVEWWIKSRRVENRIRRPEKISIDKVLEAGGKVVTETELIENVRVLKSYTLDTSSDIVLVEIPRNLDEIRKLNNQLLRWRYGIREIMEYYLARGYIVVDVVFGDDGSRTFYVLWRSSLDKILEDELPWR